MKILITFLLIFNFILTAEAKSYLDHKAIWENEILDDTVRMRSLAIMAWNKSTNDPHLSIQLAEKLINFAADRGNQLFQWRAMNAMAGAYSALDDPQTCFAWNIRAVNLAYEMNDSLSIGIAHSNRGTFFQRQGSYSAALEQYLLSLKFRQAITHEVGIASSLRKIGHIYQHMEDYEKSNDYFNRSLRMNEKLGLKSRMMTIYNRLATTCITLEQYEKAQLYLDSGMVFYDSIGTKRIKAESHNVYAKLLVATGQYDNAVEHLMRSDKIMDHVKSLSGKSNVHQLIANAKFLQGNYEESLFWAKSALELAEEIHDLRSIRASSLRMHEVYEMKKDYKNSMVHFKTYILANDSLAILAKESDITRLLMNFELERKEFADSVLAADRLRIKNEQEQFLINQKDRKNKLQFSGIIIFVLFLLSLISFSGRLKLKPSYAEALIFVFFILLFEFLLVVLDPYIEGFSDGLVAIKLGINSALAIVLFLGHQFFEGKMKQKLIG